MPAVREIWRYPVKSMAGERLAQAVVTEQGIEGDRRWALIDGAPHRAGQLFQVKHHPGLLRYRARLVDDGAQIDAPGGAELPLNGGVTERIGLESNRPLQLRDLPGGNFDAAPILIVNLASVEAFSIEAGMPVDHRRFRANLYIDGLEPEEEVGWVGRRVQAGAVELDVLDRCVRCVVITHDPDTIVATPHLLKQLVERHEECMGVYCRVTRPGRIATGDPVGPT